MKTDTAIERELMFTRRLVCALIELSVDDARNERRYRRKNTSNHRIANQNNAIHFIKSRTFEMMCFALGIPCEKIRRKAYEIVEGVS
jgi:hypothetical protein